MSEYRYTECGLDNVIIDGLDPIVDDDGDIVHSIPRIAGLHRVIARVIVDHAKGISGKELRFLRTELGMTQAELAKMVHREHLTVGRWEHASAKRRSTYARSISRSPEIPEPSLGVMTMYSFGACAPEPCPNPPKTSGSPSRSVNW